MFYNLTNHLKIILIVFVLFGLVSGAFTQELNKPDSSKNNNTFQFQDSGKVSTLINLIEHYKSVAPDQALIYSEELYKLSKRSGNDKGTRIALTAKSRILIDMGIYDSAYVTIEKAIDLCRSADDQELLGRNYANYGYLTFYTKSAREAFVYYNKSYLIHKNFTNDSSGLAEALNGIGAVYLKQAVYDSAIYYYLELIKIGEEQGFKTTLGKAYNNISIAYEKLGKLSEAKQYLLKAVDVNQELNNLINLGKNYHSLGNISYTKRDLQESRDYFEKAIELYEETNYKSGLSEGLLGLGNVYQLLGDFDKALEYYGTSKKYCADIQYQEGYIIAYKNEGYMYERKGQYDKAINIYDSCLKLSEKFGLIERQMEIYLNLSKAYERKYNFKNALKYLRQYYRVKDSVLDLEKEKVIADLTLKYEREKIISENLALTNENLQKDLDLNKRTIQRNIYLFSGSGGIAILLFIIIFFLQKTRKDKIIAQQRIQQLEEEKKLLAASSIVAGQEEERKRIAKELHDGLGVLLSAAKLHFTTLKSKVPENKQVIEKATKLLEQANGDVRRLSHNMMPGILTKYGLIEALEDLCEKVDDTGEIDVTLTVDGEKTRLGENTEIMLYRVIQEMVNNTIKHAKAKNIDLFLSVATEKLSVMYKDDGIGFDQQEKQKKKSLGLTSIESRVKFLNGDLHFESSPGKGVLYSFEIPLKTKS